MKKEKNIATECQNSNYSIELTENQKYIQELNRKLATVNRMKKALKYELHAYQSTLLDEEELTDNIKERTFTIRMSDTDAKFLMLKAGIKGFTATELLELFIGDLIDGTFFNGSDEKMYANKWYKRVFSRDSSLLSHLTDRDFDVDMFISAWDEKVYLSEHPEENHRIPSLSKSWCDDVIDEMTEYWEYLNVADMEKEVSLCKKWNEELRNILE